MYFDPKSYGQRTITSGPGFFPFGITGKDLAVELRRFADAIESGDILPQAIQTGSTAKLDDYTLQAIFIEFAERV